MSADNVTIIKATSSTYHDYLRSLWHYRSFYRFLFVEIMMRKFRDTFFGFWWLIIRPLIPCLIFITMFSLHPINHHTSLPYPIFFLISFLSWNLFNSTLTFMPRTLLWMQGVMNRTYFPRLLIPLAGFGPSLVEFIVIICVFILLSAWYYFSSGTWPFHIGWNLFWLFPCFLLSLMLGLSLGMVASVIALFFRDIVFSISYMGQMLMFLTPVIYPISFIPSKYRWLLYSINPMAKIVEMSRNSLTNEVPFDYFFLVSAMNILFIFSVSVIFFLRAEKFLGDQM